MIVDFFGYGATAHVVPRPPHFLGYWITLRHMNTRQVSFEQSTLSRSHYLHNTQQSQPKNIHTFSGIRTRNPSNRTVADLRLRSHAH